MAKQPDSSRRSIAAALCIILGLVIGFAIKRIHIGLLIGLALGLLGGGLLSGKRR